MNESKLKSFKYWKIQEIEDTFGIQLVKNMKGLKQWLDIDCEISVEEQKNLAVLRNRLDENVSYWNEATLLFQFISPLIHLVDFNSNNYSIFREAKLELSIENQVIKGSVDFLIATGKQIPKAPFFILHEYKPEAGTTTDPQGQLLITMLAAYQRNQVKGIEIPLYGTYIMRRFFFFVYLHQGQYARSRAYDATQEDVKDIFCILKKAKGYIENSVKQIATS